MKTLNELELLFLCRLVGDDLGRLQRRIDRCHRYISRGEDKHKELAIAEAERSAILNIKKRINAEIALRELTADLNNYTADV